MTHNIMESGLNALDTSLCQIRPSPIDGHGVFAISDIQAGTQISQFTGIEMSYQDFKAKYGNDYTYTYQRRPYWLPWTVAKDCRNLITYVNDGYFGRGPGLHNCVLRRGWLVAERDISAGEELLLRYPTNYTFPCVR